MYYYSNCRKKSVTQVLTNFPVNRLGSNFVVVVSREVMAVVMEVVSSVFTAVLYLQQFCIYVHNKMHLFAIQSIEAFKFYSVDVKANIKLTVSLDAMKFVIPTHYVNVV